MQFITVASALFAAAVAAPVAQTPDCPNPAHCGGSPPDPNSYENIDITNYFLRRTGNSIVAVDFTLEGKDGPVDCAISASPSISLPSPVTKCGDSAYSFAVIAPENADSDASLALYKELGPGVGFYGSGTVPTYCHAGGNGPEDFVCNVVPNTFVTIVIDGKA